MPQPQKPQEAPDFIPDTQGTPDFIPDQNSQAAQPPATFGSTLRDLGAGIGKGLLASGTAIPSMIASHLPSNWVNQDRLNENERITTPTNTAQKIGKYGEQAAEVLLPLGAKGIPALKNLLPSMEHAGQLFGEVGEAAKGLPVSLTRSQAPLDRIAQLTEAGGPTLSAPNKLLLRSQTVNPIPYEEARDFYSNISNLSAQEKMAANKPMLKALGDLRESFKGDIGDVATGVGKGEQYSQAMKEYAQAARNKQMVNTAVETALRYGVPAAAGAGGYGLYKALKDLF